MTEWVIVFCIIALLFSIVTIIYVIRSIKKGATGGDEIQHLTRHESEKSALRTEGVLLITGLLCAASGLLLGYAITKDREQSRDPYKK